MENQFEIFDARIKHPFRMIVAGPSMSGKTVFVTELINLVWHHRPKPSKSRVGMKVDVWVISS